MIVVTTPTGQIGRKLVENLLDRGESVRVIVRDPARLADDIRQRVEIVVGTHSDPAALDAALPASDALFWLVPPDRTASSARQHYLDFARAATAAIRRHDVGHVVGISSAGHGWTKPAGVLSAAFAMDAELAASGAHYRALSLPFYLENLLGQLDWIRDQGAFALAAPADRPFATIATDDIARAAADLLTDRSWRGQEDVPVFGPDRLTPGEMAEVMSEELGRAVAYRAMTIDELASSMRAGGATDRAVRDTTEMFQAQLDGIYDADWAVAERASTDFRTWCRNVLKPRVVARTGIAS